MSYIRHSNHPQLDPPAVYGEILSVLCAEVERLQAHEHGSRKGSIYLGITGHALLAHNLAGHAVPGLSPPDLYAFADATLGRALSLSPTSLSNPSTGCHSSFLETFVGIATLTLIRAVEQVSVKPLSTTPFAESWTSCAQLIQSVTTLTLSEDRGQNSPPDDGCEVLYGRAGLLYALLRLRAASRRVIHPGGPASSELLTTVRALSTKDTIKNLVEAIIRRGESGASLYTAELAGGVAPPLMWSWHGKRYLGAAHGVAGILHILLLCPADVVRPHMPSILRTAEWLIGIQRDTGNWPTAAPSASASGSTDEELVQWCHGASGILIFLTTLLRLVSSASAAAPLLRPLIASVQAGAGLVYRHGLLRKGLGLCHGVAGSVFALVAVSDVLDRAGPGAATSGKEAEGSGDYYLARAAHLARLAVTHDACGDMRVPDHPFSLYEGRAGMCAAWAAVLARLAARNGANREQVHFDRSGMPGFDDVEGDTWVSW
ncbi:hypothetical protein GGX14DRAFT_468927 [Mycena pura]|uniref:Uncharacterized protein n=1 Tax=Mycena pura TaxID=153505 RepID=A0AAD6Y678_9AGAR|nr:hypothetical protein GGX14DRAFT_468927 [Mycena pura]